MTLPFSHKMRLRLLLDQAKVDPHVVVTSQGLERRSLTEKSHNKNFVNKNSILKNYIMKIL